ncbi:13735_t:CDS:2 [Dentiscutata erythropus]|uniref:13735_t:CDS:1 n=1 Tax=Dentiscutata erythropus TaxID=1348616 RepID=A0A9N9CL18_9GLOM|nr:13735_t:CDS:2 [Dentiscutata erythropus]
MLDKEITKLQKAFLVQPFLSEFGNGKSNLYEPEDAFFSNELGHSIFNNMKRAKGDFSKRFYYEITYCIKFRW